VVHAIDDPRPLSPFVFLTVMAYNLVGNGPIGKASKGLPNLPATEEE
jgi:hypothetical protein